MVKNNIYSNYNKKPDFHWTEEDHLIVDEFFRDGFNLQQKAIFNRAGAKESSPFAYQRVFNRLKNNPKYVRSHIFECNKTDPKPKPTFYYNEDAAELIIQEIHRIDSLS